MNFFNVVIDMAHGWGPGTVTLRLLIACCIGVLIGLNRELKNRSAGVKTHVLVCIGSALAAMTSQYVFTMFPADAGDINRISAQVISGVGFLGVGTIMITGKKQVRGLTTAAGLWACACAGIAIGIGFIEGTVIAGLFIMLTLTALDHLDKHIHQRSKYLDLYVEFETNRGINALMKYIHANGIVVDNFNLTKSTIKGEGPVATIALICPKVETKAQLVEKLRESDYIKYAEEL